MGILLMGCFRMVQTSCLPEMKFAILLTKLAFLLFIYNKTLKDSQTLFSNIIIIGAIEGSCYFADKVSLLSEKSAKTVLAPKGKKSNMSEFNKMLQTISVIPMSCFIRKDNFYFRRQWSKREYGSI